MTRRVRNLFAQCKCNAATRTGGEGSLPHSIPVDDGSTAQSLGSWRASPMALHRRFESSTPPPRAHTFEILLLITIAPNFWVESISRPILIGAPGKAFCVNTAPHWVVGSSGTISVRVIVFGSGASCGTNLKLDVPTRKPSGRVQSRLAKYSELDLKLRQRSRPTWSTNQSHRLAYCTIYERIPETRQQLYNCAGLVHTKWLRPHQQNDVLHS